MAVTTRNITTICVWKRNVIWWKYSTHDNMNKMVVSPRNIMTKLVRVAVTERNNMTNLVWNRHVIWWRHELMLIDDNMQKMVVNTRKNMTIFGMKRNVIWWTELAMLNHDNMHIWAVDTRKNMTTFFGNRNIIWWTNYPNFWSWQSMSVISSRKVNVRTWQGIHRTPCCQPAKWKYTKAASS